jgi:hypothetical protein
MDPRKTLLPGLVVLLVILGIAFISLRIDTRRQEPEQSEDASDVLTYTMVGALSGYCEMLINRFSKEFGVKTEYVRLLYRYCMILRGRITLGFSLPLTLSVMHV